MWRNGRYGRCRGPDPLARLGFRAGKGKARLIGRRPSFIVKGVSFQAGTGCCLSIPPADTDKSLKFHFAVNARRPTPLAWTGWRRSS
ncbi:hypothetical protein CHELA40_10956 [Chelatococcus asaccharovorans]|nr:hypothetical protein CHELA40_10956 [Chelatococcus asaccharovorans]CAH1685709.1 hypothetical protein CHELA17_64642 [Chelatococcus asaccharovorans]